MSMRRPPLFVLALTLALSVGALVHAADDFVLSRFTDYLDALRVQAGIPGLAAAIVGPGDVLWDGVFGRQDVDGVPESLQRLAQAGPLLDGKLDVDGRARLHPRIDRVLDGEVLRRAHQICPLSRLPFRRSHDHKR